MSRTKIALAAAGLLVAAGAIAAVAAHGHRGGWRGDHMMFGEDGGFGGMRGRFGRALTKDEFDARTRERFARLDKNGDNVIDAAEVEAAINERMSARQHRWGGREGTTGERMLRRMGAGPDGKLTKDAFRTELTRRFAEMDLNNDGRIDDNDLPPMMRGRTALSDARPGAFGPMRWLRMLGVEAKDGTMTREDILGAGDRQFERLDRNKDGIVDKADMDALRKEMTDYRVKRFIHQFGADKDGRVTREQFQAKAAERFARMDFNADGAISRDEMPGRGRGMRGWQRGGDGEGMMGPGGPRGPGQPGEPPAKN
jgi:Ca2+-binding EF-hand superfamily protein